MRQVLGAGGRHGADEPNGRGSALRGAPARWTWSARGTRRACRRARGGLGSQPVRASCRSNTLTPGHLRHGDGVRRTTRTFRVHVPPSYTGRRAVPLVLDLHALGETLGLQQYLSLRSSPTQAAFIPVRPHTTAPLLVRLQLLRNPTLSENIDDVGFLRALVDQLAAIADIDHSRVYATGHSNGASMAHRLACEAADVFAAVVPVANVLNRDASQCTPARPITVVHFHGLNDVSVAYDGGVLQVRAGELQHLGAGRRVHWAAHGARPGFPEPVRDLHLVRRRGARGALQPRR